MITTDTTYKDIENLPESVNREQPIVPENIIFYSAVIDKYKHISDVKINYTKFHEVLLSFGFLRYDIDGDFIMVRVQNKIVEEVNITFIQDVFFDYLNSLASELEDGVTKEMLIEKFNRRPETYFSKKRFSLLRSSNKYDFVSDTKDSCYIFYNNGFVECSKERWQLKKYSELNGLIWKSQIHDRCFSVVELEKQNNDELGIFAQFVKNISGSDDERFGSLCTIIGYNLHGFREGKLKATVLTDSRISDFPDGRTGKSLLAIGIGKIKKNREIKGKDFDPTDKNKYQEVELDDQIVTIDDARKNFDFELMFNDITEGVKVNKKFQRPFTIKPKIIITTNRTIKIEGGSAKDRAIEYELADYYSCKFSPEDEFNLWFFGEAFSKSEWLLFDNFMMFCISLYLQHGIKIAASVNLERRKLIENTNSDFVEFMDNQFAEKKIIVGVEYVKQDLHKQFLADYSDYNEPKSFLRLCRNFTSCLYHYAMYTPGILPFNKQTDERKSGSKRIIVFRSSK